MLRTLELQGYRGFESFRLADLKRVNLLVGRNNCGKTSILEAIHFLVSRGDPFVLARPAHRRGETGLPEVAEPPGSYPPDLLPDVSHLFFGRRIGPGASLRISSREDFGTLLVEFLSLLDVDDEMDDRGTGNVPQTSLFDDDSDPEPAFGLRISGNIPDRVPILPVTDSGLLLWSRSTRSRRSRSSGASGAPPVGFLTQDSLQSGSMREFWDKVLAEGREPEVIAAMKLLEGDLDSIHFLTGRAYRGDSGGILAGFGGNRRRVPLGSLGDGVRRLLALSLSLVRTGNGFLLIDEIDTGLHYSVMEDMWKLVVATALESNVQVVATTHSYDCIQGLAALLESAPEFTSEVSVQKVERSLPAAVNLDAAEIQVAVRRGIEVR